MITGHLSEAAIQQYVLDKSYCETDIITHMELCEECMAKTAAYQLLFSEIKGQPRPAFGFDLSGLVLSQIPAAPPERSPGIHPIWFLIPAVAAALGIPFYLFGEGFFAIFSGFPVMMLCLLATSALTIFIFQGVEVYKKYQRKIDALNFY